jgi:hypothetical protein
VLRALVVIAVFAGGVLLSGCGAGTQPSALDLTACGTVNSIAAGVFVTSPLAEQESLASELVQQATVSKSASLVTEADQLQAAARAQSTPQLTAAIKSLGTTCTAMGIGPSSGGL